MLSNRPNQFNNLSGKNPEKISSFMKHPFLLALLLMFSVSIHAQRSMASPQVMSLDQFLSSLDTPSHLSTGINSEKAYLQSMLNDVRPSAYFEAGTLNLMAPQPQILYTSIESLPGVASLLAEVTGHIELVVIKVKSSRALTQGINLSAVANLNKLRYVYIIVEEATPENKIIQSISNANNAYQVLYNIVLLN